MLNRLTNVLAESAPRSREGRWETDARPTLRLTWLAALMLLPLAVIGGRVAYLQTSTAAGFAKPFEQTYESYEAVPSRDGRLLSADGRVLATDRQQFTVKVHYRWLEEPADPAWLKTQALSRLSRSERRNPDRIAEVQRQILKDREAMWQRLAALTGSSIEQLALERTKIQSRVEGIVDLVEKHRQEQATPSAKSQDQEVQPTWRRLWNVFSKSITTPPARQVRDPLIIREEQDYHPLLTGISLSAVAEIESHPELYPGLAIDTLSWRDYPQDSLAAHLIGIRKPLTAEEAQERKEQFAGHDPAAYEVGDRWGRMGLERMYDHHLHGLRGRRRVVRNRRGEIIQTELMRAPRSGGDLVLTLNANLQEQLEQMLDRHLASNPDPKSETEPDTKTKTPGPPKPAGAGASLIVLDVRTGAVVAAVSSPRFSLKDFQHPTPEQWEAITSDPRRPLFHRAIRMAVAPGSVFKTVTAVALLESGMFDPDEIRHCQGFLDRPDRHRCYIFSHYGVGHGDLDLSRAISESCNVYFFQGARQVGAGPLVLWAERLGIGRETGIDLPGEKAGNLPHPPTPMQTADAAIVQAAFEQPPSAGPPWYPGDTLGLAIGQSRLTVTPLQMARVMAAIGNDGFLVTPHLVQSFGPARLTEGEDSQRIVIPEPRPILGLTEGTLARVREGLEMVVSHPKGTGYQNRADAGSQNRGENGDGGSRRREARSCVVRWLCSGRPPEVCFCRSSWNTPAPAAKTPVPSPAGRWRRC